MSAANNDKLYLNSLSIPAEGYAYEEQNQIIPFDDTPILKRGTASPKTLLDPHSPTLFYRGSFIDDPRFGIFGKSATSGITYRGGDYVVRAEGTGNQWVNGTDSIAFGGLLK